MKKIQCGPDKHALVDDGIYERLLQHRWYSTPTKCGWYVYTRKNKKKVFMHRILMNAIAGQIVDHINGNTLDNRLANLRICSHQNNIRNRKLNKNNKSGFKGVSWSKKAHKWVVQICIDGKRTKVGYYLSLVEAARAYDKKALQVFKSYARTNFA